MKVILFSEYNDGFNTKKFLKTGATLHIAYQLRKHGHTVKQIHHCMSFTTDEIRQIIENFAGDEPFIACVSTSFISTQERKNKYKFRVDEEQAAVYTAGEFIGMEAYEFLLNLTILLKQYNSTVFLGGWLLTEQRMRSKNLRNVWGFETISKFVDYFCMGKTIQPILDFCDGKELEYKSYGDCKVINTGDIVDFSDCASTPLPEDHIASGETLISEVATGCIFSCSFCNYGTLGKKKHEYMRSYESLKNEIRSNYDNFGTTFYIFTDNIMNDYYEKLKMLIRIRNETGIDLRWSSYARLDTINKREQAELIRDSGAAGVTFGIESFKKEVGQYIGKLTDKDRILEKAHMFREVVGDNVLVNVALITGLPTETKEEVTETFKFLQTNEGRYLFDSYTFTVLWIVEGNDDKNEINKSRNNPFRDYEIASNVVWTSPWGNFAEYAALARSFQMQSTNNIAGFLIGDVVNLGVSVNDVTEIIRKNNDGIKKHVFSPIFEKITPIKIAEYKKKVLTL